MSDGKEVVIYSSEGCKPCETAKKYIEEKGKEPKEKDIRSEIDNDGEATLLQVPKICVGDKCITGFNPDKIDKLIGNKE